MMWPFQRTPKPSDLSLLTESVSKLAAELQAQSEANRKLSEQLVERLAERDSQIRLVLEAKFQPYVQMMPARVGPKKEPDSIEHLADVSEMSEESATIEAEKSGKAYDEATRKLAEALADDLKFDEIADEIIAANPKAQA